MVELTNAVDITIQSQQMNETRKSKAGRKKKVEKYSTERHDIYEKVKSILNITETNKAFYLHDIDNDKDKQQKIIDMKSLIELYFKSKNSAVFMPEEKQAVRPYMSLIRLVFKEMGYRMIVTRVTIYREQKSIYTSMYTINKTIQLGSSE
jgi:hypothetical protein